MGILLHVYLFLIVAGNAEEVVQCMEQLEHPVTGWWSECAAGAYYTLEITFILLFSRFDVPLFETAEGRRPIDDEQTIRTNNNSGHSEYRRRQQH